MPDVSDRTDSAKSPGWFAADGAPLAVADFRSVLERDYALPGLHLRFRFSGMGPVREVESALAPYRTLARSATDPVFQLHFVPAEQASFLRAAVALGPRLHHSLLYEGVPFEVRGDEQRLGMRTLDDRFALIDSATSTVWCAAPDVDSGDRWRSLMNTLLLPVINELLARSGRFLLHCGAVAWGEAGVLVAASSGGGKTTTVLSLARAGFRFISDDLTLLDVSGPVVMLRPFVRAVRILPDTLDRVPGLEPFRGRPLSHGKIEIQGGELDPEGVCPAAVARLLLFPAPEEVTLEAESRMLVPTDALERLVYHGLFVTGAHRFGPRMHALIDLVGQAPAHELRRFVPPARLPGLARELLA